MDYDDYELFDKNFELFVQKGMESFGLSGETLTKGTDQEGDKNESDRG